MQAFLYPRKIRDGRWHIHQGVDIGGQDGVDEIVSVVGGEVVAVHHVGESGFEGYGNTVVVKGDDERYYLYAHCNRFVPGLRVGYRVEERELIAYVGNTPLPTDEDDDAMPPHLHFEISNTRLPKNRDGERQTEDARLPRDSPVVQRTRLDPYVELQILGPWGLGPMPRFPDGSFITPEKEVSLHGSIRDGFFPIGSHGLWHGGVHLPMPHGSQIHVPFRGEIIAARLDELARRDGEGGAYREHGSTNFILLRHVLPKSVVTRMQGLDEETTNVGRAPAHGIGLTGCDNDPELVKEVKVRLNLVLQLRRPNASEDGAGRPYYVADEPELSNGVVTQALVDAIVSFQMERLTGRARDRSSLGVINVPGPTWRKLRQASQKAYQRWRHQNRSSGSSAVTSPAESPTYVYTLFMHLEAKDLEVQAEQMEWMKQVVLTLTPEEQAELERRIATVGAGTPEELHERRYRFGRTPRRRRIHSAGQRAVLDDQVGGEPQCINDPADVAWVQRRLKRFEYYYGEPNGQWSPLLTEALTSFQREHVRQYVRNPGDARGVISTTGSPTHRALKKKPKLRNGGDWPRFLAKLREFDSRTGTTKVVSGFSVTVGEDDLLYTSGVGPLHEGTGHRNSIHWEMFSADKLMGEHWPIVDDPSDDIRIDIDSYAMVTELLARGWPPELGTHISFSRDEVAAFYGNGGGSFFQQVQARFRSEWSLRLESTAALLAQMGIHVPDEIAETLAPYVWWEDVVPGVLPPSSKVWHYDPIEFMHEYAVAANRMVGGISVALKKDGREIEGEVTVSTRERRVTVRGATFVGPLEPGRYEVVVRWPFSATSFVTVSVGEVARVVFEAPR